MPRQRHRRGLEELEDLRVGLDRRAAIGGEDEPTAGPSSQSQAVASHHQDEEALRGLDDDGDIHVYSDDDDNAMIGGDSVSSAMADFGSDLSADEGKWSSRLSQTTQTDNSRYN
jgi:hypothetical protein